MTLLLVAGQLWRQIPSTGDWYTVAEVGPGLYAYRYSADPSHFTQTPAEPMGNERPIPAGGPGVAPQMHREEPESLGRLLGSVGGANGI